MKNRPIIIFIFSLLLISSSLHAQRVRFYYNYKSIPDSLNKENIVDELMVLELNIDEKQSAFFSHIKLKSDSVMAANTIKGKWMMPNSSIKTQYVIAKNLDKKETFYYTRNHTIVPVSKVEDHRKFDWKITNEKDSILIYSVQKATSDFGGRSWNAWFTNDIPFSDGPYKFSGLPGLILKISDVTNSHSFELIGLEKIEANAYQLLRHKSYFQALNLSLDEYFKSVLAYRKEPGLLLKQKVFRGEVYFKDEEDKRKYLRDNEIRERKELAKDNNQIEILK